MTFHRSRTSAGFTAIIGLTPRLGAVLVTLLSTLSLTVHATTNIPGTNLSFEDGTSNFVFTGQTSISLTAANAGSWMTRQPAWAPLLSVNDITSDTFGGNPNSYVQDGDLSMLFQANAQRGLAQLIDVSSFDMSSGELTLSTIVSGRGTLPTTAGNVTMRGYNDLTGLTVALGGNWDFTGGTAVHEYGSQSITGASIQDQSTTVTVSGTSATNFDYLVIIIGGVTAGTTNNLADNWVAFDDVSLTLVPEPSTFALLGLAGLAALAFRRRRK